MSESKRLSNKTPEENVKPSDSDASFFKLRNLSPKEKETHQIIEDTTRLPGPLTRIIGSYADEKGPVHLIKLYIELLEGCKLEEFKRCRSENGCCDFRFNPLTVVLRSTDKQATPQAKCEFVQYLLEIGFNSSMYLDTLEPALSTKKDMTPLMLGSEQGNAKVVEVLLDWDSDINIRLELYNQAIYYAMYGLASQRAPISPYQDYERCAKLILQQSFIHGKDCHYLTVLNMRYWYYNKKKQPCAYALRKCFLNIDFSDVVKAFNSKLYPVDFFMHQLEQAKVACANRRSLFPADKLGIELVSALREKFWAEKIDSKSLKEFYEFLENELKTNAKLAVYCQQKPHNPLAKAIFITEIAIRSIEFQLMKEDRAMLKTKAERKGP